MRNAILLTLIGVFVVSLVTIGVAYALPTESPQEISSVSESGAGSMDRSEYPYLLRSYEGKLAVFTTDLVTPDLVFEVYTKTLPDYDQEQLERGVRARSYEELTALVEDYIS